MSAPPPAQTFGYAAGTNRLATVTDASGVRAIDYDARGNTIGETRPGGASVTATYDGYARLLSYQRTGDPAQSNAYNGLDDRVSATSGSVTHSFVYDPDGRVLGEYGASASDVVAETIWLSPEVANDNQPFGGGDGIGGYAPLALATGSGASAALTWVHGNHLGVPIAFTDASGTAVPPSSYTAAGFPGQTKTLSDLYYNRYRDYDSSTGRYIQADPIGLGGGSNPFAYANDNPLRWTDPAGLAVYIGQHPAFFPFDPMNHAAIVLKPDHPEDFPDLPSRECTCLGGKVATLGGQAFGSKRGRSFGALWGVFNFPGDDPCKLHNLTKVEPPIGMNDSQFIAALIGAARRYRNDLAYAPFPNGFADTYNSNGYVSGLLRAVGASPPDLPGSRPGYGRPIPVPPR